MAAPSTAVTPTGPSRSAAIPAIRVAGDGLARVSSLVHWQEAGFVRKGSITSIDFEDQTLIVKLEDGTDRLMKGTDVARQHPHPPELLKNPLGRCKKCNGTGERAPTIPLPGQKPRECKACQGKGLVAKSPTSKATASHPPYGEPQVETLASAPRQGGVPVLGVRQTKQPKQAAPTPDMPDEPEDQLMANPAIAP